MPFVTDPFLLRDRPVVDLIPIKFQLIGVLIFLVGTLTVFHLAFVHRKRTRRFWIKADFAYYFIGVLGLVGVTDNFQDLMYNLRLGLAERAFERHYETLLQQVDTLHTSLTGINYQNWAKQGSYLYTSPMGVPTPTALPAEAIPHFRAAALRFSQLMTALAGKERTEHWQHVLLQAKSAGDTGITVLDTDKNRVLGDFSELLSLEGTVTELRNSVTKDSVAEHELIELFIAPYLIALALALRISKASAEFFDRIQTSEEQSSSLPSNRP